MRHKLWGMKKLLILSLLLISQVSFAISCDMLTYDIDDVKTRLRRAANETNLEDAKDYARKARSAFDDAAMGALDCGCINLQIELDDGSTASRRARDASDYREFTYNLNKAIRSYNNSIELVKSCRPRRK